MVWYSHPFKNFSQFVVIHTVKGFGVVSKAKVDDFMELSCFFDDPVDVTSFHGVVQLSPQSISEYLHHLEKKPSTLQLSFASLPSLPALE